MPQTTKKKRYIIGSRSGPALDAQSARMLDDFMAHTQASGLKQTRVGRRVVEMTEAQKQDLAARNPQLVIEEDQELDLYAMPGLPPMVPADMRFSLRTRVVESGRRSPVAGVTLYGIGQGAAYKAETDANGEAMLQSAEETLARVIASPADTYWSRVIEDVTVSDGGVLTFELARLPAHGYSWGHRLMQFDRVHPWVTGRDVRVAVIDSGVTDRLEDFTPCGGRNTLDGADPASWNIDEKGHGTHCAGIVNCAHRIDGLRGGAPDAQIYSLKVFPGGYVSDLVEAVEWAIQNGMDLISMSLGAPEPSEVLAAALTDACARGITVIAATGNDATHVVYPAAFPRVIAVGAIGRFGTFPADSAHTLKIGRLTDWRGELFAANFSNFGPEVAVCAPGVAILSTVPTGVAAWDGTSMACPMITALAALVTRGVPINPNGRQPATGTRPFDPDWRVARPGPAARGSGVRVATGACGGGRRCRAQPSTGTGSHSSASHSVRHLLDGERNAR